MISVSTAFEQLWDCGQDAGEEKNLLVVGVRERECALDVQIEEERIMRRV